MKKKIFFLFLFVMFILTGFSQLSKEKSDSIKGLLISGRFEDAIGAINQARNSWNKDSLFTSGYAFTCYDLAFAYERLGNYPDAEKYYLLARNTHEKVTGKNSLNYCSSCNDLGIFYARLSRFDESILALTEADEIAVALNGADDPRHAAGLDNLGSVYRQTGKFSKAESFLLDGKKIREKVLGKNNSLYAKSCDHLGSLYAETGQLEKAEELMLEAREVFQQTLGKENPEYGTSCVNLGNLYSALGVYPKAMQFLSEGKNIYENSLGKKHPHYAWTCYNLAVVFRYSGELDKAESLVLVARDIFEALMGKISPDYAATGNLLGNIYDDKKEYSRCVLQYSDVRQIFAQALGTENLEYAIATLNLGKSYLSLEQYDRAEPLLIEAKEILEKNGGPDYASSLGSLGALYTSVNDTAKAFRFYSAAMQLQNDIIRKTFQFASETEKQSFLETFGGNTDQYFSFLATQSPDKWGYIYDILLFYRQLILLSSQKLRSAIHHNPDTTAIRKYDEWIASREQLALLSAQPMNNTSTNQQLEEKANQLEKGLIKIVPEFREFNQKQSRTWQDIQKILTPHEACIEFFEIQTKTDIRYNAIIILPGANQPRLVQLFEKKKMDSLIEKHTGTINYVNWLYKTKANELYQLIWAPLEKELRDTKKIFFSPSGLLYNISVAAIGEEAGQLLSDRYELVQLNTTAAILDQTDDKIISTDNILLYGGVKYDADTVALKKSAARFATNKNIHFSDQEIALRGGFDFQYLPGTEKEVISIKKICDEKSINTKILKGVDATEESLKNVSGDHSPTILHIATHGYFFPDVAKPRTDHEVRTKGDRNSFKYSSNPLLRSGLLLSGANYAWNGKPVSSIEDGILTAFEVSNMYLPSTKLAVLSACETGLGQIKGSEGVFGLQRAFKMAGVKSLIMSLWKVPDRETSEFMQEFYSKLANGETIEKAFSDAQTTMKNKYRDLPFNWAGWILVR